MSKGGPVTKTVKASEARQQWSGLLNEVFKGETRVIVEKSGIPVAAIISNEDLQRLIQVEVQRAEDFKVLEESWNAFKDVDPEEIEREVAKAVLEARRQLRTERLQASKSV